jgi:hypothetical protein
VCVFVCSRVLNPSSGKGGVGGQNSMSCCE